MAKIDLYKIAIEQYREHPRTYWTRARFFILIQSALISFVAFQIRDGGSPSIADVAVACLGTYFSFTWFRITKASQGLLRLWRNVVKDLEDKHYHLDGISVDADGEKHPGLFKTAGELGEGTTDAVSITTMMISLSRAFLLIWALVTLAMLHAFIEASFGYSVVGWLCSIMRLC